LKKGFDLKPMAF